MSEKELKRSRPTTFSTLLHSVTIFLRNKQTFVSIYALTAFPLSFLLFSLSSSTRSLRFQIRHLEAVAFLASTHIEALFLHLDTRITALSLLRIEALYFLPCYALSLLAAVTAVTSASLAYQGNRRPSLVTALSAVRLTWKRPLVTSICVYAAMLAYAPIPRVVAAMFGSPEILGFAIKAVGLAVEIYLMAVASVGLVVSIEEERYGLEAIRVGWGLMAGRRVSGWVLSGGFVLVMFVIMMMELEDGIVGYYSWSWKEVGFMGVYGIVVMLSYVVTTVFYCDCRTHLAISTHHHHHLHSHKEIIDV